MHTSRAKILGISCCAVLISCCFWLWWQKIFKIIKWAYRLAINDLQLYSAINSCLVVLLLHTKYNICQRSGNFIIHQWFLSPVGWNSFGFVIILWRCKTLMCGEAVEEISIKHMLKAKMCALGRAAPSLYQQNYHLV